MTAPLVVSCLDCPRTWDADVISEQMNSTACDREGIRKTGTGTHYDPYEIWCAACYKPDGSGELSDPHPEELDGPTAEDEADRAQDERWMEAS